MTLAVEWPRGNRCLFRGRVQEPWLLDMPDDNIVKEMERRDYGRHSVEDFPISTSFVFDRMDDLDLFWDLLIIGKNLKLDVEMK